MHRLLAAVLCCAGLAGCGGTGNDPEVIDFLPGARVGELAEKQLEAEHPDIAVGAVTCPDLDWQVNASVRCVKVSELSEGRRVKVPGTVTVTSTESWGKLHVVLDDRAAEFGIDGGHLGGEVADWVESQEASPGAVDCPYLTGMVGSVARCAVTLEGVRRVALATVTAVEPDEYRTRYALTWED